MLRTLQAGRAFAAISVAAFHLSITMGRDRYGGEAVFSQFTHRGNLGVDFFFVLSGFIILFAHASDVGHPERWRSYINRRFVRVFPIYWLYTAVFVGVLFLGAGTDAKMPSTWVDWLTSLTLIRFSEASAPLDVAWTLFHEVAFYLLFSLLLLNKRVGIVALAAFCVAGLARYLFPPQPGFGAFDAYFSGMNVHFFFGMVAYWLFKRGASGVAEALGGTVVTFVSIWILIQYEVSHIFLGLGFGLVVAGFAKLEASGRLRVPAVLGLVGDASYTLYLIHLPLQGVILKIVGMFPVRAVLGGELTFIVVMLLTVIFGVLAYLFVERPLLGLLRNRSAKRSLSGVAASRSAN